MAVTPRAITSADIDPNGNVVIWDHGPLESDADHKEWHDANGDGPVPLTMHSTDAAQALSFPERYSLDPLDAGGEVDAEVAKIVEAREAAKKHSDDLAAAAQLAADRRVAFATVMAKRRAAELAKPPAAKPPMDKAPPAPPAPAAPKV